MSLSLSFFLIIGITLVMGILSVGLLLYLKGDEIRIPRLAIWIIWYWGIFGLLGLVAVKYASFPVGFWLVQIGSLLMGILYLFLAPRTLPWWNINQFAIVFLTAETFLCWGLLGMAVVYGLLTKESISLLPYLLLGALPFILPLFFYKAFYAVVSIPSKRYKRWFYPEGAPIPKLEPVAPIEVVMRFTKFPDEPDSMDELKPVEFPSKLPLGLLFHYFINYYNVKMNKGKINYANRGKVFGWEFYRVNLLNQREYLDFDKSLVENQVKPKDTIYAESFTD